MIRVKKVSVSFETRSQTIHALKNIDFEVREGSFTAILGPSGCGKTTLLRVLAGLQEPSEGGVEGIFNSPAKSDQSSMSFIFQNPALMPWRTVKENIRLPSEILKSDSIDYCELLELVGLQDFGNSYPRELSGGMQQRAALARGLSFDPEVLLMDEPFGALDDFTRYEMNQLVQRIFMKTGVTIFFVTHNIEDALTLADRVISLSKRPGEIVDDQSITYKYPRDGALRATTAFQQKVECLRKKLISA